MARWATAGRRERRADETTKETRPRCRRPIILRDHLWRAAFCYVISICPSAGQKTARRRHERDHYKYIRIYWCTHSRMWEAGGGVRYMENNIVCSQCVFKDTVLHLDPRLFICCSPNELRGNKFTLKCRKNTKNADVKCRKDMQIKWDISQQWNLTPCTLNLGRWDRWEEIMPESPS